jgi:hypothetical protein
MKHSLSKAIRLHERHMRNPETATMQSQAEMMRLLRKHRDSEMPAASGKRGTKRR